MPAQHPASVGATVLSSQTRSCVSGSARAHGAVSRRSLITTAIAGVGLGSLGGAYAHTALGPAIIPSATSQAFAAPPPPVFSSHDRDDWALFKASYIAQDGRIVDPSRGNVSHTEGQGLGMLFAEAFGDRACFDLIYQWTDANLERADGLYTWRWSPGLQHPKSDPNNATDGDIYIAAALIRAARRWNAPTYAQSGIKTARSILQKCTITVAGRTLLLPGEEGFQHREAVVINPSYYVYPLLQDLAGAAPSPIWGDVVNDGLRLLLESRSGRWLLPADWLQISRKDGRLSLAEAFPQRFSYDAVRIPLFLKWSGIGSNVVQSVAAFWRLGCGNLPCTADLKSDAVLTPFGLQGVESIATFITSQGALAKAKPLSSLRRGESYYSMALHLLAALAAQSSQLRTFGT